MILPFLVTLLLQIAGHDASASSPRYEIQAFSFPPRTIKLVPADINGDDRKDLVVITSGEFGVYLQRDRGFAFEDEPVRLRIGGDVCGWDLVDLDGTGRMRIVAATTRDVRAWEFHDGEFGEPQVLQQGFTAALPRGFYQLSFARDVDGDGDADLIVPEGGTFAIHLRGRDGRYQKGPSVTAQLDVSVRLDGDENLDAKIGQSVHLPIFSIRDFNGDGTLDLVSRTSDLFEVHLADENGVFPRTPSFRIDVAKVRRKLGPAHSDDFDRSNIMAPATRTVQLLPRDVNGDGAEDLVIRSAGTVDLYLGTRQGIDTDRLDQRLKASGNVVAIGLQDEDEDGIGDLWIFRVETVSMGSAMLWLLVSGSLDFEALIYRLTGNGFARRPSRRITITLRFPALLSLMKEAEELRVKFSQKVGIPAAAADLSGSGESGDVVVLENAVLRGYLKKADTASFEIPDGDGFLSGVLRLTNYSREKDQYVVDLENLSDLIQTPGASLRDAVQGAAPDLELSLPGAGPDSSLFILDLNGDNRDDLLLIYAQNADGLSGAILRSAAGF